MLTFQTKLIQNALADCGWLDARMLEQQDTSEAFAFLTETLQLPLLSLQVDLFHQGRRDEDDHKVVYERLLNLAVPPDPEGKGIQLEDCLEEYFNAQVDVLRDSEVAKKSGSEDRRPTLVHRNTLRLVTESQGEASTVVTASPIDISPLRTVQENSTEQDRQSTPVPSNRQDAQQSPGPSTPLASEQSSDLSAQTDGESGPALSTEDDSQASPGPSTEQNSQAISTSTTQQDAQLSPEPSTREDSCATPTQASGPVSPKALETAKESQDEQPSSARRRPSVRARSASVIQHVVIDGRGRSSSINSDSMLQKAMRKGSTVVKAVTIPAWQFFRLIRKFLSLTHDPLLYGSNKHPAWHALSTNEPQNDVDVALNFEQRPVVGICLKRYAMTESGQPKRHNTFIDIPDSLRLPHFMLADEKAEGDETGLNTEYKLVLQSVICHRGDSLQSGHYISFARVAPKLLTDNRRHDSDPPPDYEEAQWAQFDDLDVENRVSYVDDIRQSLRDEMPYLLFYQVVPMVEVAAPSSEGTAADPPSYIESKVSIELPPTPVGNENNPLGPGYFDNASTPEMARARASKPPSIRLSGEVDRPPRKSTDGAGAQSYSGSTLGDSRRQSLNYTDSAAITPSITPESHSPSLTPGDESTASRLSRAASKFAKGRQSRPVSQSGEGRISITMNRLGGLMKANANPNANSSKDGLLEPSVLNISSNSIASESVTQGEIHPIEGDKTHLTTQGTSHHKHGHKRGKSKEKVGKQKAGPQPERVCTVM